MKLKCRLLFLVFFFFTSVMIFSQSKYFEEGVSGTGFFVDSVITDSGIKKLGFSAGYSIGGIMDFGVSLGTESVSIDSHDGTDLNFALMYNMIIIKQTELNPINIQLEGSYGFTNTTSEYLDGNDLVRTGQGFNFGAFLFHRFNIGDHVSILAGGKIDYKNYITTTYDYTDPNVPVVEKSVRSEEIRYGGTAGLSFQPDLLPIFTVECTIFYNPADELIEYLPTISITSPLY